MRSIVLVALVLSLPSAWAAFAQPAPAAVPDAAAPCAMPCDPEALWLALHPASPPRVALQLPGPTPGTGDCGSGRDADIPPREAIVVLPVSCDAAFSGPADDWDEYGFDLASESVIMVRVTGLPGHVTIWTEEADRSVDEVVHGYLSAVHVPAGHHYVSIYAMDQQQGAYHLEIWAQPFADSPDCLAAHDAPDAHYWTLFDPANEVLPTATMTCTGTLDVGDINDAYNITTDGTDVLVVDFLAPAGRVALATALSSTGKFFDVPISDASGAIHLAFADATTLAIIFQPDDDQRDIATPYELRISHEPLPTTDDCGTAADLPSQMGGPLLPEGSCDGAFTRGDLRDGFDLPAPPAGQWSKLLVTYEGAGPFTAPIVDGAGNGFTLYALGAAANNIERRSGQLYVDPADPAGPAHGSIYRFAYATSAPREGPWRLTATYVPDDQDDCGAGHDAPGSVARAVVLVEADLACDGTFADGDNQDAYSFDASPGDLFTVYAHGRPGGWLDGVTWTDAGSGESTTYQSPWGASFARQAEGAVALRVSGGGPYGLAIRHVADASLDDCGSHRDAREGRPVALALPVSCGAELTTRADAVDAYTFDARAGEVVRVGLASASEVRLTVGGVQARCATLWTDPVNGTQQETYCVLLQDGTATLDVGSLGAVGTDPYSLGVSLVARVG